MGEELIAELLESLSEKTGEAYIETLREIYSLAEVAGGVIRCGLCGKREATHIAMQECGQPGGAVCLPCVGDHFAWVRSALSVVGATTYCRHCNTDVGGDHTFAVGLRNPQAVTLRV